jgi:hypothetical protein
MAGETSDAPAASMDGPRGRLCSPIVKIENAPFQTTDWSKIAAVEHPGEQGVAHWRTIEVGNLRVRMVEYSPGYVADHWCERGHVILVLEGELVTELRDGRRFVLGPGVSYQVADGDGAHRSVSPKGAKLFIVD